MCIVFEEWVDGTKGNLTSNGKGHALEEPDYTPNVEIMFWILKYKCSIYFSY